MWSIQISVEGENYHKTCFRCNHGGCTISPSNYAALNGILYCKPHFAQLFKEKGNYNHLLKTASMKKHSDDPVVPPDVDLTDPAVEGEAPAETAEKEAEPAPDAAAVQET